MRHSLIRLAQSVTTKPLNLREASATLLPPIPLYRRLLRAHRSLPREMRSLGDDYVKAEFRRHREVTNPAHIIGFLSQWKMYLDDLPKDGNGQDFTGKKLDPTVFEKMSTEQLGQLYELMHATKDSLTSVLSLISFSVVTAMDQASITVASNIPPYSDLPAICSMLFEAKARKGMTFDQIAKALGKDEVWVAAAFYGQAKFTSEELTRLSRILDIPAPAALGALGDQWWPNRGLGPMPPTDPVIYRLYEGVLVYGHAIKAVIHEKIQTYDLDVFSDPLMTMLSSMDSNTTFFDPFAPTPFPEALGSKLQQTYEDPSPLQPLAFTQAQFDALRYDLASPIASPSPSLFEIEDDTTKYEPCYDEFMETKLSVIKELSEKAKLAEPVIEEPLVVPSLEPTLPLATLESFVEDAYILPDTFLDDLWEQINSTSDNFASSPCPSTSTTYSTSTASSVSVSTPTPPTSAFTFSCPTPFDFWDNEADTGSVDDNPKDGDYQPSLIRNEYRATPWKRPVKKQGVQCPQAPTQMDLFSVPLPDSPMLKTRQKRKAPAPTHDSKRQKINPEVVCRINGCRHISKTRFECFKHRETHFPGRFQCPHPDCLKVFVRSSSLARHLKRPRNAKCSSYSGSQAEWGVGLIKFALRPPAWFEPSFLDDITEL
ncbi:hypothetical protein C0995_005974 [Termitomyces sp. Mi166|nr:hypothetical protein C0995_005974 [Termitomyces sp. Mi166\